MENDETNSLAQDLPEEAAPLEQDDETVNLDAVEEEVAETPEANAEGAEGEQEQGTEAELAFVQIEHDGQVYEVPEALQSAIMKNADYTQKTQEVAETRRQLEEQQAQFQQIQEASTQERQLESQWNQVNQQLQQYDQYTAADWQQFEAQDPMGAQQAFRERQMLIEQRASLQAQHQQAVGQRTQAQQQEAAKRMDETRAYAQREIPGWTIEKDKAVTDFAFNELGLTKDMAQQMMNPQFYRGLYLAHIGAQTLKNGAAVKPRSNAPQAKPLTTIKGKTSPDAVQSVAEIDDMDAYASARRKQMGM